MKTVWLYTVTLVVSTDETSEVRTEMGLVTAADADDAKARVRSTYKADPWRQFVSVEIHDHIGLD